MYLRWTLAVIHLLGLGVGLGAIWARARELSRARTDAGAVSRALTADSWWGLSAILWIGSGLWRLLAGTEKATPYYLGNHLFWTKMALLGLVLLLELRPMALLIRWRIRLARGESPDLAPAPGLARLSYLQTALILCMVVLATALARGFYS